MKKGDSIGIKSWLPFIFGFLTASAGCELSWDLLPGHRNSVTLAYSSCVEEPDPASPNPPVETCNYMDWKLSSDGFYKVSRFGTTLDSTTLGHTTSCGYLQGHYDYHGCSFETCAIPWIQGHVDYDYDSVIAETDRHMGGDVPRPEYFYVAGAQRFNCGTTLRVSNPTSGRCVVVYVEDGGPGSYYEESGRGGRRILDASPAVVRYLQIERWGWADSDLVYVEWGLPGDVPGRACTRCQSLPAGNGFEFLGAPFDINDMMPYACRAPLCSGESCGSDGDPGDTPPESDPAWCGNGACDPGEDCGACPDDCCGPETGCTAQGHLGAGEHGDYCSDAPETWRCVFSPSLGTYVSQVCRGGIWQTFNLNPRDCGSCCGDYSTACDLAAGCGDGACGAGEDCGSCPSDCGSCGPVCGNGTCEAGEDCGSCSADCGGCGPVCGNAWCEGGEDCSNCPADCGACPPSCPADGHLGTGENDDQCFSPSETWRCVYVPSLGSWTSQVCRDLDGDGVVEWWNYNLSPRDCAGCCGSYSTACDAS